MVLCYIGIGIVSYIGIVLYWCWYCFILVLFYIGIGIVEFYIGIVTLSSFILVLLHCRVLYWYCFILVLLLLSF